MSATQSAGRPEYTYVDAELQIINFIPKIATVGKVIPITIPGIGHSQSLIHKVPDATALQPRYGLVPKGIPVVVQVAVRIPHCVTVLTQNNRSIFIGTPRQTQCPWHIGVHGADDIRQFGPASTLQAGTTTLITNGARGIQLSHEASRLPQIATPA